MAGYNSRIVFDFCVFFFPEIFGIFRELRFYKKYNYYIYRFHPNKFKQVLDKTYKAVISNINQCSEISGIIRKNGPKKRV